MFLFGFGDPTSRKLVDMGGQGNEERDRHALLQPARDRDALLERARNRRLAVRLQNSVATEIQKCFRVKKAFELARLEYKQNICSTFGEQYQRLDGNCSGNTDVLRQLLLLFFNAIKENDIAMLSQLCNLLLQYFDTDEMVLLDVVTVSSKTPQHEIYSLYLQATKLLDWLSIEESLYRRFSYEWFYSPVDYPWVTFGKLSFLSRLTRSEWSTIRSCLGKHCCFSDHSPALEKEKLEDYCENVRKYYAELSDGLWESLPAKLARPLSVGQHSYKDFYLDLSEDNRKVTPRDYLELALTPVQTGRRDVSAKNAIRESIRALFPDRDCYILVRPVCNEKDLQRLDQLPLSTFRPEFTSGIDAFTKFVFDRTRPKQLGASTMPIPNMTLPRIVGIMDGSPKRFACNVNAKRKDSSLDEDFGNEFLSSWKVPKSGKDAIDFDFESVAKSNKKFTFDNLADFGLDGAFEEIPSFKMGMFDLDFSSPVKKKSKHSSSNGNDLSEGRIATENDKFFSFDFKELELFSAGSSPILNAPSSTAHSAEENSAISQVVIEFLNLYFEFTLDTNSTISSVVSLALRSKGITELDCYYSCQLEYFSGHELIKNTGIKTGSILHVHARIRGGSKNKRSEDEKSESNKKLKTTHHVELDIYISLLKSKRQQLWFEKVDIPYDLWWNGFAAEVQLAADSRKVLTLILDCMERVHDAGYCYNDSFPVKSLYYNSILHVVEILNSDAKLSRISPLGLYNDYTRIGELIPAYFSYVRAGIRRFPIYIQAFLAEIASIITKPGICSNSISRAALSRPLCIMSSSQRLSIFTSVIIYAKADGSFRKALSLLSSPWRNDFQTPAPGRIPSEFLARSSYKQSDGNEKLYIDTLFSHSDYARCCISHSQFSGKVLDAALYRKWENLLVNLQAAIIEFLTNGKPPPEKVPDVPTESSNQVELFTSIRKSNEVDLREVIGLV